LTDYQKYDYYQPEKEKAAHRQPSVHLHFAIVYAIPSSAGK